MNPHKQDINRLAELLKTALRREEAPPGFAERVLTRVEQRRRVTPRVEHVPWFHVFAVPAMRWAALATISTSLIVGTVHYRNLRRERVEGETAKQQLMLALHIAGGKLQLARSKVNGIQTSQPERERETNKSRSKS